MCCSPPPSSSRACFCRGSTAAAGRDLPAGVSTSGARSTAGSGTGDIAVSSSWPSSLRRRDPPRPSRARLPIGSVGVALGYFASPSPWRGGCEQAGPTTEDARKLDLGFYLGLASAGSPCSACSPFGSALPQPRGRRRGRRSASLYSSRFSCLVGQQRLHGWDRGPAAAITALGRSWRVPHRVEDASGAYCRSRSGDPHGAAASALVLWCSCANMIGVGCAVARRLKPPAALRLRAAQMSRGPGWAPPADRGALHPGRNLVQAFRNGWSRPAPPPAACTCSSRHRRFRPPACVSARPSLALFVSTLGTVFPRTRPSFRLRGVRQLRRRNPPPHRARALRPGRSSGADARPSDTMALCSLRRRRRADVVRAASFQATPCTAGPMRACCWRSTSCALAIGRGPASREPAHRRAPDLHLRSQRPELIRFRNDEVI